MKSTVFASTAYVLVLIAQSASAQTRPAAEAQLRGEPASLEDAHFHPIEPRQVRISVRARF